MTRTKAQLDALLERVAAGELDALAPDEIDALQRHLDEDANAADRLADVVPEPEGELRAVSTPTAGDWDRVWNNIDASERRTTPWWLRITPYAGAAAACILLALILRVAPAPVDDWAIQLGDEVEINEIEVFGNASVYVDNSAGGIVWLFEEDEGA